MMRSIVLGLGILGMLLGAGLGLYAGQDVHAAVARLKAADARGDVDAYNAAVPQLNAAVQLRSLGFGIVLVGALLVAAPAGYDTLRRLASR